MGARRRAAAAPQPITNDGCGRSLSRRLVIQKAPGAPRPRRPRMGSTARVCRNEGSARGGAAWRGARDMEGGGVPLRAPCSPTTWGNGAQEEAPLLTPHAGAPAAPTAPDAPRGRVGDVRWGGVGCGGLATGGRGQRRAGHLAPEARHAAAAGGHLATTAPCTSAGSASKRAKRAVPSADTLILNGRQRGVGVRGR